MISQINFKADLKVIYIDEFGMEEQGLDQGGLFKEFMNDLSKIIFNQNYGLFTLIS
jgi:ubiquitin-protein ligase E3 C